MFRPYKVFRIILWSVLTWFLLALLWAFLPFPLSEHDGDSGTDYATSVLRSGKSLTRVYDHTEFHVDENTRWSFALDYTYNPETNALSISGPDQPISLTSPEFNVPHSSEKEEITATARIGDSDGANLPWFNHADAVLLFWWIHKETINISLTIHRSADLDNGISTLDIQTANHNSEPLLSIQIPNNSTSAPTFTVPSKLHSASPSSTYPIRVFIIHIIAPTAIIVNGIFQFIFPALAKLVMFALYGFFSFCGFVAFIMIWKRVNGASLDRAVGRFRDHLGGLQGSESERLTWLPMDGERRVGRLRERTATTPDNEESQESVDKGDGMV